MSPGEQGIETVFKRSFDQFVYNRGNSCTPTPHPQRATHKNTQLKLVIIRAAILIHIYNYLVLFYLFQLDADFIPKFGLLHYLNITLKQVPRMLRESYDDHVCRIGEHIKSNSMYARVLARILVPELAPEYDFCKVHAYLILAPNYECLNRCHKPCHSFTSIIVCTDVVT